jgi:host factor-I protein
MNRKLIRPNLTDFKEKASRDSAKKKLHPPFETYAENYYFLKQMNKKTQVAIVFMDGETIEGYIEWYDRQCIKLNRSGQPNLLIYKSSIKYIYKLEELNESQENKKPVKNTSYDYKKKK